SRRKTFRCARGGKADCVSRTRFGDTSQTRPIIVLKQTGGHSPPLSGSWTWKVLPRCPSEITSRRFRKQIIAWRRDYASHRHSFWLDRHSRGFGGGEGCRAASVLLRRSAFTAQCGRRGSGQASGRRHHAAVLGPRTGRRW